MLCEHCKTREATIKYVEVINGVKSEHNLCTQCASRLDIGQYSALFEGEFPLGRLLSGLLGMQDSDRSAGRYADVVCPTCGTTYEEFVKDSRFGCPDCYSVFDPLIGENIKHLQGSERHVGKRPRTDGNGLSAGAQDGDGGTQKRTDSADGAAAGRFAAEVPLRERMELLQARIRNAVQREEYEEAAVLRDELHKLKEEIAQNGEMV